MKNLGKNVINILIGMVIAIFLITALLWFLNRSFFEHPPLQQDVQRQLGQNQKPEHTQINITNLSPGIPETDNDFTDSNWNGKEEVDSNDPIGNAIVQSTTPSKASSNSEKSSFIQGNSTPAISKNGNISPDSFTPETKTVNQVASKAKEKSNTDKKIEYGDDKLGHLIRHIEKKDLEGKKTSQEIGFINRQEGKKYLLQMGSFQTAHEAQNQKEKLHNLGISSQVRQTQVYGQTYYRVMSTETYDKNSAQTYKLQLRNKGIDSSLLLQ